MTEKQDAGAVTTRWMELITALVIVVLGLLVVYDSHRVGAGWAEDGPQAGYFPNMIGWILA
jgi:putative tricarboxylic transport membrane protein